MGHDADGLRIVVVEQRARRVQSIFSAVCVMFFGSLWTQKVFAPWRPC